MSTQLDDKVTGLAFHSKLIPGKRGFEQQALIHEINFHKAVIRALIEETNASVDHVMSALRKVRQK